MPSPDLNFFGNVAMYLISAVTYSTMYMYILYATIPGPRVVTDAEFHIATEPNGYIEFLSIVYQNIKKRFTFKNLKRFVSL